MARKEVGKSLVYELDADLPTLKSYYLGNQEEVQATAVGEMI